MSHNIDLIIWFGGAKLELERRHKNPRGDMGGMGCGLLYEPTVAVIRPTKWVRWIIIPIFYFLIFAIVGQITKNIVHWSKRS